jgi:hypothetical protein
MVDDQPVQLVSVYYDPDLVAGSKLEQPCSSKMASTPNYGDSVYT